MQLYGNPQPIPLPRHAHIVVTTEPADDAVAGRTFALAMSPVWVRRALTMPVKLRTSGDLTRCHCHFDLRADGWWIVDNGSVNGTQVAGERVREHKLTDGDRIGIPGYRIEFRDRPAPPTTRSSP